MAKERKAGAHRGFWIFFRIQLLALFLVALVVGYYYVSGYADQVKELRSEAKDIARESDPSDFRTAQTSEVYDADGNLLSRLKGEKDVYYLEYGEIPIQVQNAIISTEDKDFFNHKGYDLKGIARAVWAMLRNGEVSQGGSTITQQLAKNIYLTSEKTWQRKVEEIYLAVELERKYSKSQILEFYINNIYFANGYYGICAASKGYFSKAPGELSLSETAFLCGIPNSPANYDPLTHMDNALERRDIVLGEMLEDEKISVLSFQMARDEDIKLTRSKVQKNNYLETYAYNCATRIIMEKDGFVFRNSFGTDKARDKYDAEYASAYDAAQLKLYSCGYRIYTSLDQDIQKELQASVDGELADYDEVNEEGVYTLQSAAVCIDNQTGLVKAIVGGRSQDLTGYTLNRAYQSFRQPGSAIKPLIVYTPALERGYTVDSTVSDVKSDSGPANDQNSYAGEIPIRSAVAYSKNTVAWNLFEELGPTVGISYLLDMEFSKIDDQDYRLPSALGGFTTGVSPVEMASGFATIENDGVFRSPTCVTKITDAEGNAIYDSAPKEVQVYELGAARQMTDLLTSVMDFGTGKDIKLADMPCAGKTGTTNSNKDGWFVGFTRYYTTSVWVGYDMPKELAGLQGATYPGKIWQDFMTKLHEGLQPLEFKTDFEAPEEEEETFEPNTEEEPEIKKEDEPVINREAEPEIKKEGTPVTPLDKPNDNEQNPADGAQQAADEQQRAQELADNIAEQANGHDE